MLFDDNADTSLTRQSALSLGNLPEDILLEISLHLDVNDFRRLSQASLRVKALSERPFIWNKLLVKLLQRARYVDLLALDQKPLTEYSVKELERSILKVASAEENWNKNRPECIGSPYAINLRDHQINLDQVSFITKFSSRHLLIPSSSGNLLGWDLRKQRPSGSIELPDDTLLIDLSLDASSRSLVCLVGNVVPVRNGDSFGMHVRLSVLYVRIPEPESPEDLKFEKKTPITLLVPFQSELHLLDVSRRMLCFAFACLDSQTACIFVMFDWDTEEAAIFDTGLPYVYGKSLTGVHISEDGKSLIVQAEVNDSSSQMWYNLDSLVRSRNTWNALEYHPEEKLEPFKQEMFKWENEPVILSQPDSRPYLFWQVDQNPRHPYPNIPLRRSTVVLHVSLPKGRNEEQPLYNSKTWTVTQHYSDLHGPCSKTRSFLTLSNPALSPSDPDEHSIPITCIAFNHMGWIEETVMDGSAKRVMKIVTFPDPGVTSTEDLVHTAKVLDIPSEVLMSVYHILLDETQGLVIMATVSDTLHFYQY